MLDAVDFAKACFRLRDNRLPNPHEIDEVVTQLDYAVMSRQRLLVEFARGGVARLVEDGQPSKRAAGTTAKHVADPMKSKLSFLLLGTGRIVSVAEWEARLSELEGKESSAGPRATGFNVTRQDPPQLLSRGAPRAAVIVSLFRSEPFLDSFLQNLAGQSAFLNVEVAIASVAPSNRESKTLQEFAEKHSQVTVHRFEERIGIYDAWNRMIEATSAPYITNMNVDDMRRRDSLSAQIAFLDGHPWVDVAYQDVYYTLDRSLTWDQVEEIGFRSALPHVTPSVLLSGVNAPHNAPMWRRTLHGDLGMFNDSFVTAGDFEFWVRCVDHGRQFLKMRDAHVAYFVNPRGLSTQPDGHGAQEAQQVIEMYEHLLGYVSPPAYLAPASVEMGMMSRAERLTLGAVRGVMIFRGGNVQ